MRSTRSERLERCTNVNLPYELKKMQKLIIAVILLTALATTAQSQPTYIGADGKSVYTDANQSEYEALSPQEKNQAVFTNRVVAR